MPDSCTSRFPAGSGSTSVLSWPGCPHSASNRWPSPPARARGRSPPRFRGSISARRTAACATSCGTGPGDRSCGSTPMWCTPRAWRFPRFARAAAGRHGARHRVHAFPRWHHTARRFLPPARPRDRPSRSDARAVAVDLHARRTDTRRFRGRRRAARAARRERAAAARSERDRRRCRAVRHPRAIPLDGRYGRAAQGPPDDRRRDAATPDAAPRTHARHCRAARVGRCTRHRRTGRARDRRAAVAHRRRADPARVGVLHRIPLRRLRTARPRSARRGVRRWSPPTIRRSPRSSATRVCCSRRATSTR